jgi:hypothetical protein
MWLGSATSLPKSTKIQPIALGDFAFSGHLSESALYRRFLAKK